MHEKVHERDYRNMQSWLSPKYKKLLTEKPQDGMGPGAANRHGHQRRLRSLRVGHIGDIRAHAVQGLVI